MPNTILFFPNTYYQTVGLITITYFYFFESSPFLGWRNFFEKPLCSLILLMIRSLTEDY